MANLNETDEWFDGIYQLEEDDPVLGGPAGIDNLAPRQLASRGRYQRIRNVSPWRADFIYPAGESYVSYGGQTWKSVGTSAGTQPGTDPAKWVRWGYTEAELGALLGDAVTVHEAKADPHPVYWNDPRGNAKIAAAIAALVNSSPAALDTLAELAAALGNDANFAATVTAALATKAPLASPALTGNPTAPTQAATDNSQRLANTAFVRSLFPLSLGTSGYIKLPGGLILQWVRNITGTANSSGDATIGITYPTTFPNLCCGTAFYPVNEATSNFGQRITGTAPGPSFVAINIGNAPAFGAVAVSGIILGF